MNRAFLITCMILLLAPVWFMFTGSLQDVHGVLSMPPQLFPKNPTLMNYRILLSDTIVLRWLFNTALVVVCTVTLSVTISITAGYAFAFYLFPFKQAAWLFLLSGILAPRISVVIPLFVVIKQLGMSGTLQAVILATALSPVGIYLSRAYFQSVPKAMLESARMDGCNEGQVLFRVVAPISRPIITTVGLFAAIAGLQDYMWQMLILQKDSVQTMLVGLTKLIMRRGGGAVANVNPVGLSLSAGVILLVPLLLIFAFANKYFTSAIGGALKE